MNRTLAVEVAVMDDHDARAATLRKMPLINREQVRDFLLEKARETRAHKFTRVSEQTLIDAHGILKAHLLNVVRRLPSKGQTI